MCSQQVKKVGNKLLVILSRLHNNSILISNLRVLNVGASHPPADMTEVEIILTTSPARFQ